MAQISEFIAYIVLSVLACLLLVLFIIKSKRTHHIIPFFIISYAFIFAGLIYHLIVSYVFEDFSDLYRITIQMELYGLFQFFFYLFLSNVKQIKRGVPSFYIILILLIIQQFVLILIMQFQHYDEVQAELWFYADIAYNTNGIIIFLLIGAPLFTKNYRITKSITALLLALALYFIGIGYCMLFISDILWTMNYAINTQTIMMNIGNAIAIGGELSILFLYFLNIQHFFHIPHDLFIFLITNSKGETIFQSKFAAINSRFHYDSSFYEKYIQNQTKFTQDFKPNTTLTQSLEDGTQILSESNKVVSAVIISNSSSQIMINALRRFLFEFRNQFHDHIFDPTEPVFKDFFKTSEFVNKTVELMVNNFPFLISK